MKSLPGLSAKMKDSSDDSDAASVKTDQSDLLAGVSGTLLLVDMSAPPPPVPGLECVGYSFV